MQKNYYQEYYDLERKHWWGKARNRIIMDHIAQLLKGQTQVKILNVGVATGYTSELLERFGPVKSVEYDRECFEFVKAKLRLDIVNASITDLPFEDEQYDLVCAFDVVEHVEDDQLAVQEMKRVCKKEGLVVVTVPAYMSLWSHHDVVNHHFRRYRKHQLKNLFKNNGKILRSTYFNFILFFPIFLFRVLSKVFPRRDHTGERSGSDVDVAPGLNGFFYRIFISENSWLKLGWNFPVGVSILLSWKKTS